MQILTSVALTFAIALGTPADAGERKATPAVSEAGEKRGTTLYTLLRKRGSRSASKAQKIGTGLLLAPRKNN